MSREARPLLLIVNPQAGRGRGASAGEKARRILENAGVQMELALCGSPDETRAAAERAAEEERVAAAVCGGDGSAHAAANALAHTNTALALIPAGRANDFARAMGIPDDAERAAQLIARHFKEKKENGGERGMNAEIRQVDLGNVNGTRFCTVAAFGIDAHISRETRRSGRSYLLTAVRQAWTYRHISVHIRGDFGKRRLEATLCAAANTAVYGKRFQIAPGAETEDGLLNVCLIGQTSRFERLRLIALMTRGAHVGRPNVEILTTSALHIETEEPQSVYADGEPVAETPASFKVEQGALLVLAARRASWHHNA